ncbi:MAG: NAD(P)/FAD-dependent oxidoreductase [Chloroflexi bacterium]|nr:NAD(P)/FAD-dependent oxidoreductase [Chloroflexota bacterium]
MADLTFDAVIIGGGNKALMLAMYLTKYGGMSVGIFESRHELGGGLSSEEAPAPGFIHNTHSTQHTSRMYYEPLYQDFPDFEEKGAKYAICPAGYGMVFKEDMSCLLFYQEQVDPTQERTAKEIARFSGKDAETWLKLWDYYKKKLRPAMMERVFNPPRPGVKDAFDRLFAEKDSPLDPQWASMTCLQVGMDAYESKEITCAQMRGRQSADGIPPDLYGSGLNQIIYPLTLAESDFAIGGSHSVAHASARIVLQNGGKVFTGAQVEKAIIENGRATGIQLKDGSTVKASKAVISTLSPHQLCFDIIGKDHLSPQILKKVANIETRYTCLAWYGWALHDAPVYKAAAFNPDANNTQFLALGNRDLESLVKEASWRRLGLIPPELNLVVWCYSISDPTQAPQGKHAAGTEQFVPPARALTERQWLEFKPKHAADVVKEWELHSTNMGWRNVIGYFPELPPDIAHLANMAPDGNWAVIDCIPTQQGRRRPIPELSTHRTPIKDLYATGSAWHPSPGAHSYQAYNCYKVLADDLGLRKPWAEKGRPF